MNISVFVILWYFLTELGQSHWLLTKTWTIVFNQVTNFLEFKFSILILEQINLVRSQLIQFLSDGGNKLLISVNSDLSLDYFYFIILIISVWSGLAWLHFCNFNVAISGTIWVMNHWEINTDIPGGHLEKFSGFHLQTHVKSWT